MLLCCSTAPLFGQRALCNTSTSEQLTPSGLRIIELVEGDGASPEHGQTVQVHYTGWLENGNKFDSSRDRGEPIAFPVGTGRVIQGWDEGILSMKASAPPSAPLILC